MGRRFDPQVQSDTKKGDEERSSEAEVMKQEEKVWLQLDARDQGDNNRKQFERPGHRKRTLLVKSRRRTTRNINATSFDDAKTLVAIESQEILFGKFSLISRV